MHIRINDASGNPLSSLLDTGSSLSIIDRQLLETLGGTVQGQPLPIHGIGSKSSLGWSTMTFFVAVDDAVGQSLCMECTVDFHVLEAFAPGLCLGQNFISTHVIAIHSRRGTAVLEHNGNPLTFPVREHMPGPYARQAELCTTRDIVIPARSHAWVPVDTASLAPGLNYTAFPRLMSNAAETVRLAGPLAVIDSRTAHVLLTNVGTLSTSLARRTPVADAVVAQLGEVGVHAAHVFDLPAAMPGEAYHAAGSSLSFSAEVDIEPLDVCESVDGFDLPSPTEEVSVAMVDGVFKVGLDAEGRPHPDIVAVLRRHSAAFALDGRPGRVVGHEMSIDLDDDRNVHPEAPRRASPEKQRAMDATIDQLLEWEVIEPLSLRCDETL